ncbi:hypothetical protein K491DRAFT_782915 [Lophiostoma macrostomum CBS 122681]|uniref:Mid2 domain-containing protein n=1 Tax=Lophiostoma macrostomum CBS 122681 TaxID=1314788 RepID=A0A6A6SST3_9PLEO|nr:hypothetical protein K491DRAFT_782915 [Lophiostoma macrostomum CBS 122681]
MMRKTLMTLRAMALLSTAIIPIWAKSPDVVRPDGGRVAAPVVTPRALLPRVESKTVGWYSSTMNGSETIYTAWQYDADETTFISSSSWFRRCEVSSSCAIYTDCSGGYLIAADTSSFCGTSSSGLFCSHHVSYTSSGASVAYSWYWCDLPPLTGITFYGQNPDASTTQSTLSSHSSIAGGTSGSMIASSLAAPSGSVSAPSATASTPPNKNGSNNTGIIAGGVVGGVAAIVIIAIILFCCCCRRRRGRTTKKTSKSSAMATTAKPRRTTSKAWPACDTAEKQEEEARSLSFNTQPEYYPIEKQNHNSGTRSPYVSPMLNSEDEHVQRANARWSAVSPIMPSTHADQHLDEYRGPEPSDQHASHAQQQYYDTGARRYGQNSDQFTQRPWV